ncbi:MAG TPA: HAMP domain-containing sensor histidine kinase [Clostridia bacterium]|nr:HAMP domain-containing sensor histidine kinase [Clostridia bacterium]
MTLPAKLTGLSISLIAIAVISCCAIILSYAQKDALSDVTQAGLQDHEAFYRSFRGSASVSDVPEHPAVRRSFILSAFRGTPGAVEFTLRLGSDFLSNNVGFDVESAMKGAAASEADSYIALEYKIVRVNGKDYFLAHGKIDIGGETYDLSLARDISDATGGVRALALRCLAASLVVTALAATLMWLLVFRSLKPIRTLQESANLLSRGQYENRIAVEGRDELAALARDFNSMADAVEENVGALRETAARRQAFINGLSHEMKTPVTAIMLSAETLLNRRLSPEESNRALARIYNQSKWLESLSQKLMALVLVQGEIEMRPESVADLLGAVKETVSGVFEENGIELIVRCGGGDLCMDFDLMRAALANLADNARKASRSGQTVELCARGNIIEVTDHGRGIPREEIARVTEPFYMVDRSRSKKRGGAGLGLALVRQIAEAHGARLEIESVLDEGTTVRLAFPDAR